MRPDPSKAWFAPKRYGYGAGLPIAWQGWAVLLAYLAINIGAAYGVRKIFPNTGIYSAAILIVALISTIVLILICAKTTKGGWHWRWGGEP